MIRDTSAQDSLRSPLDIRRRTRRRWLIIAAAGLAFVLALAWLVSGWSTGGRSVDASRLRIATVTRGDLVRDLSAEARVITANSPTLYAIAGGTVRLA